MMGVLPFGLIYGVTARSSGLSLALTQAMSSIVFAGSAQFVAVQLLGAGLPLGIILLTTCVINLRHALYSLSLAPYLRRLSVGWKLLLGYLLVDEVYAIAITRFQQRDEGTQKHWYFLGSGLTLWSVWQASTAVGMLLGANIPASWSLDFALPLTFIALVVPALKQRVEIIVAVSAGLIAVLAAHLPLNSGLLVATFISILLGLLLEVRNKKRAPSSEEAEQRDRPLAASLEKGDGKELQP